MWKKGLIYIICCFILCVSLMGCGNRQEKKIDKLLKQASRYLEELDYEEAIRVYSDILEIDEKMKEALGGIAHAYIEWAEQEDFESALDKLDTAISYAEEAFKLYLDDEDFADLLFAAYVKAGSICEKNGYIEDAIRYYKEASKVKEEEEILTKIEELENAEESDEKASAVDVEEPDWDYLDFLSNTFNGMNYYISDEERNMLCNPLIDELIVYVDVTQNAEGYFYLADLYRITGNLDKCIELRKEGFQKTHMDKLNPEGYKGTDHRGNSVLYNQYNQAVEYNGKRRLTYDGNKVVETDDEYTTVQLAYDAQGRVTSNVTEYKDMEEQSDTFTYEYDISNSKVYMYNTTGHLGHDLAEREITYDEYGRTLEIIWNSYVAQTTDGENWEITDYFVTCITTYEYNEDGSYEWTETEYDSDGTVLDYRTEHVDWE